MWTLGCGMWDLVPWLGIQPQPPVLGVQSLSHWTTKEVPYLQISLTIHLSLFLIVINKYVSNVYVSGSVQFSCSVMSDSLWPHELQHARPPCPSPTPRDYPNSCPSSQWCHPAISSSVVPFSSCPQSLPASESFPLKNSRDLLLKKQINKQTNKRRSLPNLDRRWAWQGKRE